MKLNLIVLLLLYSYAVTAQFSDAKLVLSNSDTLVGKAKLRYDTVVFRGSDANTLYFGSKQVRSVIVDNETYFSSDYLKLSTSGTTNSFFVKVLVQGDIVLYYRDENPKDQNSFPSFFIGKKESPIIELVRLEKKIFKEGSWYTQYYDAYKNQLTDYFKDCPNQIVNAKKNFFTESQMIAVVEQYSNCKNLNFKKSSVATVKPTISLLAGVDYTHLKFSANGVYVFQFIDNVSASSTMPFIGLKLELPVKRSKSAKFVTEMMLKMTNISFDSYKISVTYLKVNLGADKIFQIGNKSNFEIHAGLALSPIIGSEFTSPDPTNKTFAFKTFEFGFWYGAGINLGRTGLFIRNENFIGGFASYSGLSMSGSYLYGGLKYKVSK